MAAFRRFVRHSSHVRFWHKAEIVCLRVICPLNGAKRTTANAAPMSGDERRVAERDGLLQTSSSLASPMNREGERADVGGRSRHSLIALLGVLELGASL